MLFHAKFFVLKKVNGTSDSKAFPSIKSIGHKNYIIKQLLLLDPILEPMVGFPYVIPF
jgi:hypothetical protein